MGKTFRRNSQFRPKKAGRVFVKDQSHKKHKHVNPNPEVLPDKFGLGNDFGVEENITGNEDSNQGNK